MNSYFEADIFFGKIIAEAMGHLRRCLRSQILCLCKGARPKHSTSSLSPRLILYKKSSKTMKGIPLQHFHQQLFVFYT